MYEKPLEGFGVHLAGLADGPRETYGSQIFAKTVSGSENAFRGPENARFVWVMIQYQYSVVLGACV